MLNEMFNFNYTICYIMFYNTDEIMLSELYFAREADINF
jgi:hypothetical protein